MIYQILRIGHRNVSKLVINKRGGGGGGGSAKSLGKIDCCGSVDSDIAVEQSSNIREEEELDDMKRHRKKQRYREPQKQSQVQVSTSKTLIQRY